MMQVTANQVGEGAQTDVWMRPNVDTLSGQKLSGQGLIEKESLDRVDAHLIGAAGFQFMRVIRHHPDL
jgi:hypothetical protein